MVNTIAGFERHEDGSLTASPGSPYTAGGLGSGKGLGSQGALQETKNGRYVGARFVGPDVAEWLHAATIAVVSRTPVELLWQAIPAFSTRSEVRLKLLERRALQLRHPEQPATT